MSADVTDRYIDVGDDLKLHLEVSGEGPPLVLIHGFTGSTATWSSLRPAFEEICTVIAVDLPGHGRSSVPVDPGRYRLERFAADLARVLDELWIDRAVVHGYSMGGRTALRFAIENGERLAGLILESASSGIPSASDRERRVLSDADLADTIERDGLERFVDYWERLSLWETQKSLPDEARAQLRAQRMANNPVGLANSLRGASAGRDVITPAMLSTISAPTLLIVGELDGVYLQHARILGNAIPESRVVRVPECGHAVHFEKPHAVREAVAGFLRTIPSTNGRWV